MAANEEAATTFAASLVKSIRECCSHPRPVLCHTLKERMWEKYYKLCSSEGFRSSWKSFLQNSIGLGGSPIFFQFVTKAID